MKSVRSKLSKHINIKITFDMKNQGIIDSIKSLISEFSGNCRFILNVESSSGHCHRIVSDKYYVSHRIEFIKKLRDLLGAHNVWIGI